MSTTERCVGRFGGATAYAWGAVVAAAVAGGCGQRGPALYRVHGTVSHGGSPVPQGVIVFEPDVTRGNRGPQGYASIFEGRYDTAARGCRGTSGGAMLVRIDGSKPPAPGGDATTGGAALFATHEERIELPSGDVEKNFDVPARGAR